MLLEERNDVLRQVLMSTYAKRHPVAVIPANHTASEVAFQRIQDLNVALMLDDGEFRKNLKARGHFLVRIYAHVKATFSIHEPNYPLRIELQRWLLNMKSLRIPGSSPGLSCGLSPCPSDFYCRSCDRRVPSGCGGVSRI